MTTLQAAEQLAHTLSELGLMIISAGSTPAPPSIPTFSEYIAEVSTTASRVQIESYRTYWRITEHAWGSRRLTDPTPKEVNALMEEHKRQAVVRSNWSGGAGAARNLLHAIRCLYSYAEQDGIIRPADNPSRKAKMPRRPQSARHALTAEQISDLGRVACETGNDAELDALIVRLHIETACRRSAVLQLTMHDLSVDDSTVRLHHKGGTTAWHPITPMLMHRLYEHFEGRGGASAAAGRHVLRTRSGSQIGDRRYDNLHQRFHTHLPWAAAKGVTAHWLRHTTLTFVERHFGEAVARRYAAHHDPGTTATPVYTKASLPECARALEAVTGQSHPLARSGAWDVSPDVRNDDDMQKRVW